MVNTHRLEQRSYTTAYIELVVDLDHGGVDTGPETLELSNGEQSILGRLARMDAWRHQ